MQKRLCYFGRNNRMQSVYFQSPTALLLNLCIPVVDADLKINGWSKLLNSLQIIILPMVITILNRGTS